MFNKTRKYYSMRTGKNPNIKISFDDLKGLFLSLYTKFEENGYFQEYFGYYCVDNNEVDGKLGADISAAIKFSVRKDDLWPLRTKIEFYSEDDLFDMIEFLYDHISLPLEGYYHQFNQCGYHYSSFNQEQGRKEFVAQVNSILEEYNQGYELSDAGEILTLAPHGMDVILQADIPLTDTRITERMDVAIANFRRYRSTFDERRHAIRDLADVLELLRPKLKEVITKKDEGDLFNIANNFGIRHLNEDQKTSYDKAIWYSWMFYYYLATIHACIRLLNKPVK